MHILGFSEKAPMTVVFVLSAFLICKTLKVMMVRKKTARIDL